MDSQGRDLRFIRHDVDQVAGISRELRSLYAAVYAEPPYYETEADVADFESRLASQMREPAYDFVAAWDNQSLAGYIYGFAIRSGSPLWETVFLSPDPRHAVDDWIYPVTFVSELLVSAHYRRRGIAQTLHNQFIAMRTEPKAVLLAHPEAMAAQSAYKAWGWYRVGAGRPWPNTPLYDTLVKDLARPLAQQALAIIMGNSAATRA
jgi:GNAT superfamily N-acetyltransferase